MSLGMVHGRYKLNVSRRKTTKMKWFGRENRKHNHTNFSFLNYRKHLSISPSLSIQDTFLREKFFLSVL